MEKYSFIRIAFNRYCSKKLIAPFLSFAFFLIFQTGYSQTGSVNGYIKNSANQQPVEGALVLIEKIGVSATTDSTGFYTLKGIKTGTYTLKASHPGFETGIKYDVIITSGNTNNINFQMGVSQGELGNVNLKGRRKPFLKALETPLSTQSFSAQELKSFPGANFDVVKVAQSLPGVSGSVGFRNDLIIRGGAPNESVYYLDGIEVPNINHFATQGSGGGPVGMVNVAFVDEVTLSTSAFHARFDNAASGVLQFRQKEGNRERTQGNFRLGASEAAVTLEGPLSKNKKWTYLASVRRSYLQFLFRLIDLPFLPDYWDYQYKVTYKPTKKDEIYILGLNAIDNFTFNPPTINPGVDKDEDIQRNLLILYGVPKFTQYSATAGVNWRHLLSDGFTNLAVSSSILRNGASKYENNQNNIPELLRLRLKSDEWEHKLRFEVNRAPSKKLRFAYGFNLTASKYTNDFFSKVYIQPLDSLIDVAFNSQIAFLKGGAFGSVTRSFMNSRLSLTLGLRTDVNNFLDEGMNPLRTLSPRFSGTYAINSKFNINASVGRYFKIPPYTVLGYKDKNGEYTNRSNAYIQSDHLTGGLEWLPQSSLRITLEGFYKIYANYPISVNNGISLANLGGNFGFIGNEPIASTGKGRTYGVEFSIQKKLTKRLYGILAYTWFISEFTGANPDVYIPSAWDNRHLITFTGGYKFKKNYEIGTRFRFLGSAPYTPFDTASSRFAFLNTGEGVLDFSRFNQERFRPYFAIDIRIDKKWSFKRWSLDVFLDLQNVTAAPNPSQPNFTYRRDPSNPDNFINTLGQSVSRKNITPALAQTLILESGAGSVTPALGVVIEF